MVKYGDQFEKLTFRDLIEVKQRNERDLHVDLKNPEYDITSAIKKVLYSYQGQGDLFAGIAQPVTFIGYFSPDARLPGPLVPLKTMVKAALDNLKKTAQGKLTVEFVDPDQDQGKVAQKLERDYGFRPMAVDPVNPKPFWFYMIFKSGDQVVQYLCQNRSVTAMCLLET